MPSNESPLHLVTAESVERKSVKELFDECMKMPTVQEAFNLLDRLPTHLKYHTKDHTFGERGVVAETILFAHADGVPEDVIQQQVIAAAWHDVGFLYHVKGKVLEETLEDVAVTLFNQSKEGKRLGEKDISETISNISDTTMRFGSNGAYFEMRGSKLGYMLDADLSNFGRDDFFERMNEIAEETGVDLENSESCVKFYKGVISLLMNHKWHTEGARKLREVQKQENLNKLIAKYNILVSESERIDIDTERKVA